jgi:hypothetical protein
MGGIEGYDFASDSAESLAADREKSRSSASRRMTKGEILGTTAAFPEKRRD